MGCLHPRVEEIRKVDGTPGIRCLSCGSTAYKGESLWTVIKRNVFGIGR